MSAGARKTSLSHGGPSLTDAQKLEKRRKSAVGAVAESLFVHIKRSLGECKIRYCGLAKNTKQLKFMSAMFNLRHYGRPLAG